MWWLMLQYFEQLTEQNWNLTRESKRETTKSLSSFNQKETYLTDFSKFKEVYVV